MRTMPQPKKLPWSLRCGKFRRSTDHQNISKALVRTRFDTTPAAPPGTLRTNADKSGSLFQLSGRGSAQQAVEAQLSRQSRFSSAGSRGSAQQAVDVQLSRHWSVSPAVEG